MPKGSCAIAGVRRKGPFISVPLKKRSLRRILQKNILPSQDFHVGEKLNLDRRKGKKEIQGGSLGTCHD